MSKFLAIGALLVLLVFAPLSGDAYLVRLGTLACMYAVMAASWNLIGGLTGYPSFGTAAFFGVGAYTSGILCKMGVALPLAVLGAGVLGVVLAAIIGFILLRLKGHYFAIATLAIVELFR
jgi:branched-chain amino acid transport system permease protein